MTRWVDSVAGKSRTERVLVRDHPTWGWFKTTYLSDRTKSQKKHERDACFFYFLRPPCPPIEPLGGLEYELGYRWPLWTRLSLFVSKKRENSQLDSYPQIVRTPSMVSLEMG